jgi:RNA polymerase sigma-B factor
VTSGSDALSLFAELAGLPEDSPRRRALRDELIEMHLPLVDYLARRFGGRGEPHDDLVQVGTIGLIKAVDRFDVGRGVEFSTYATPTIIGEIKRHFRDKGWTIRVPRRLQELRSSIASARADLTQELERAPTARELANRLKVSEDEVLLALEAANAYSTVSLDASPGQDMPTVGEAIGSEDAAIAGVDDRESIRPLLSSLPDREKRLLTLRFFGNLTQSQIAAEMGISQMHVSRLLSRTLAQLRERLAAGD